MVAESISYWQSSVPDFQLSTDLPPSVEVVVIGGGLLGASTCYWLARAGVQVALLERTALASGATGRNGGFVRAGPAGSYLEASARLGHDTAYQVMDLTTASQALLRQVIREEGIACDYREPGTLRLAVSEAQAEQYRQDIAALHHDGFPALWLDCPQVQDLLPVPVGPQILGARYRPRQGLVHSARLVQGLMCAALRYGARAYQANVSTLVREGAHLCLQTSRGRLVAQTVVLAVNAWSSTLLPELAEVIVPVLEQMLAYEPVAPVLPLGISADLVDGEYFQQTPSGHILVGGCGVIAPNAGVGVWECVPTAVVQEAIEQVVPQLFPSLAPHLRVARRWAGLLGCTTDAHPIVDVASALPAVFFVGGFSGHGMPFGMRFGQLLAQAVTSGSLPPELSAFRLDRPSLKKWRIL
jgi:glycine/D-amino acid oxidase-like deaminating enzyme